MIIIQFQFFSNPLFGNFEMLFKAILLCLTVLKCCAEKIPLKMMEETAINTEIGDVLSYIDAKIRNTQLQFTSDSKFVNVTENGKLVVGQSIDLETLCLQHKLCCGLLVCVIETNILVNNNDKDIIISVEFQIQILDKNDHKPSFLSIEQYVQISEFTQIGTSISLVPAADGDATVENRIQNYRLNEQSGSFSLDLGRLPSLSLRVTKRLDYEEKNRFEGTLQACDPDQCMSQRLVINLKDENDNQPIFEIESYNITIKEDIGVGSSIVQVKAHDKDSGKFGEIRYVINVDSDLDLKSTFTIDNRNGQIQLRQKLSTNTRDFYRLRVLARDLDPLNPKQSSCVVTIKIEDVNDHKPIIKTLPISGPLNISENVPPKYVTTLKITDEDQGKNAIVQCRLDPNCESSFELISNTKNVYSLKTLRQFDHEQEQQVDAVIICKDQGEPSQETVKVIPIYIIDVNEYRPYFKTNDPAGFYRASIIENSQIGKKTMTITAYDKDKSAVLRYQIDNAGSEFFQIDSRTGDIICANKELDRERISSVTFTVHVTDSLIDPNTVSVQVKITVLDANDNSPVFPLNLSQFSIIENTQATRLSGQLTAKDDDQDENAMVTFSLQNAWNGHTMQRHDSLFHVTSSGFVETLAILDREKCDTYILEVMASDSSRPPQTQLSSKVNITVKVLDENDNAPIWIYPDLNVYNISDAMRPGDQLIQLRARDIDIGANGKIRFDIVSQYRQDIGAPKSGSNSFQYFSLNSSTGHLSISQILHAGTVVLKFRVSDYGLPVQTGFKKFIINISGDDSSNLNMTIIAVMITVTAVISLFLIVAIICVRRKPPKYHSPASSILTKDQPVPDWIGLRPAEESHLTYQTGNKSPYLSNSLRPSSVIPVNDGTLQMHTFTPNCPSYEHIDGDSGDSGKGPSEEGSNSQHPIQEGSNYYSLRQPNRGSFRPCVPIPTSPTRSACHCYVLPEDSIIQPGYPGSFPVYTQCGDNMSIMSGLPSGYNTYSSMSLPRNQYAVSRQRNNSSTNGKFQQYNDPGNSNQSNIINNNNISSDFPGPRLYSRLTPMHVRRISDRDNSSCTPDVDDRAQSLGTAAQSGSANTKTVFFNGPSIIKENSEKSTASTQIYTESVEA